MLKALVLFVISLSCYGCSGQSKEDLYADGAALLKKGNANGAIVLLKNALDKDPDFFEARYQLATAYVAAQKFEQAEKEFQKVLLQVPGKQETRLDLARLYNTMKKPEQAITTAGEYLKSHRDAPDALGVLGEAYALQGNLEQSERYLLQALNGDPHNTPTAMSLANIYLAWKKYPEARQLLSRITAREPKNTKAYYALASLENSLGYQDKALEIYQHIAGMDKTDVVATYKMGLVHLDRNEVEKADQLAAHIHRNFPDKAEGIRLKGLIQYNRKNYADAIPLLQESLRKQASMEGLYFLGLSLYNRGELENALNQFRKILDYNPAFVQARLMTGVVLLKQMRLEDAINEMKKVVQQDERHAFAHNILGSAYLAKGMYEEGMTALNRATELDPSIVDAYLKKGMFHFTSGKAAAAETDLQTAVRVAPDVLTSRLVLSSYYVRRQEYAKALAALKEGLSGKKSDAVVYNGMAQIHLARGKQEDGADNLAKAKVADPSYLASYLTLADVYSDAGNYDRALVEYRSALQFDPNNLKALLGSAALCDLAGRDGDAVAYFQKAKQTGSAAAYGAMAGFYLKKNDRKKALSVVDEGLKLVSRDPSLLELKGRMCLEDKRYPEAVALFQEMETTAPQSSIALRIYTYLQMKNSTKAVELARNVIAQKPGSGLGYRMLASIYQSQNNLDAAVTELKKGLGVDTGNVETLMMLGNIQAQKKDSAAAMATFEEVVRQHPDFAPAYYAQGVLLELAGKKKQAASRYSRALAKSANYVPALNNLACLSAEGFGSKTDALRLAMKAYKIQPGNPAIMETLGYVLLKNGRKTDSLSLLQKAADRLPHNPNAQYHLALALTANGNKQLAKQRVKKALQLGSFTEESGAKQLMADLNSF